MTSFGRDPNPAVRIMSAKSTFYTRAKYSATAAAIAVSRDWPMMTIRDGGISITEIVCSSSATPSRVRLCSVGVPVEELNPQ